MHTLSGHWRRWLWKDVVSSNHDEPDVYNMDPIHLKFIGFPTQTGSQPEFGDFRPSSFHGCRAFMSWVFRSCGHGSVSTCRMSLRSAAWRNNLGFLLDSVDRASCSFGDPGWNCRIYRISDIQVGCVHYITPNLLFLKRAMSCCRFHFNLQQTVPHSNFGMKSLESKNWPQDLFIYKFYSKFYICFYACSEFS